MNANKTSISSSVSVESDVPELEISEEDNEGKEDNENNEHSDDEVEKIPVEVTEDFGISEKEFLPEPEDSDSDSEHKEEPKDYPPESFLDDTENTRDIKDHKDEPKYETFTAPKAKLVSKDKFSQLLETAGITITDVYYISDSSPLFIKMVGTNVFCIRIPQNKYDFPKIDNGIAKTYTLTESSDIYDFFSRTDTGVLTEEIKLLKKRPIVIMGDTCICTGNTGFSVVPDANFTDDLDLELINRALDERLTDPGAVKIEDWNMLPCINFKEFLNMLKTNDLEFEVTNVVTEISGIQEDTLESELARIMKAFERAQSSIKLKFYTINSRRIETINTTKKLNASLLKFNKELEKLNNTKQEPNKLSKKPVVDPSLKMKLSLKTKSDLIRKSIDQNVKKTAVLYNQLRNILQDSIKLINTLDINS
jgi:hypothetical protein